MHKDRPLSVLQSIILLKLITGIDSNLSKIKKSFLYINIVLNKLQIIKYSIEYIVLRLTIKTFRDIIQT